MRHGPSKVLLITNTHFRIHISKHVIVLGIIISSIDKFGQIRQSHGDACILRFFYFQIVRCK